MNISTIIGLGFCVLAYFKISELREAPDTATLKELIILSTTYLGYLGVAAHAFIQARLDIKEKGI